MPFASRALSERLAVRAGGAASVAAAGAGLALAGLAFAAVPLLVAGIGFITLSALAITWVALATRGASVSRSLPVRRVIEGQRLEAVLEVRAGRLALRSAAVTDPLAGQRLMVPARTATRIEARLQRRGRQSFDPPSLRISDPLSLVRADVRGAGRPDEVLVLPRTEPVRWLDPARRRPAPAASDPRTTAAHATGEIDGLRAYLPGTPAARIHWPALARGAGLLERRLSGELGSHPVIILDARTEPSAAGRDALDTAVRAAASLVLELARRGGCAVLLPGAHGVLTVGPDLAAWPGVHARLALVERSETPPAVRPGTRQGHLIWVTASPLLEPQPSGRGARDLTLVAPIAALGELDRPPAFEVAGCAGLVAGADPAGLRLRVAR